MKTNENDHPGSFETPWWVEHLIEWEATSATDKKVVDWVSSEDESYVFEEDEELKMF